MIERALDCVCSVTGGLGNARAHEASDAKNANIPIDAVFIGPPKLRAGRSCAR